MEVWISVWCFEIIEVMPYFCGNREESNRERLNANMWRSLTANSIHFCSPTLHHCWNLKKPSSLSRQSRKRYQFWTRKVEKGVSCRLIKIEKNSVDPLCPFPVSALHAWITILASKEKAKFQLPLALFQHTQELSNNMLTNFVLSNRLVQFP